MQHVMMTSGNVTLVNAYMRRTTAMAMFTAKMGVMNQPYAVSACARFTIPIFVTISNCRSEGYVCSYVTNRYKENMHRKVGFSQLPNDMFHWQHKRVKYGLEEACLLSAIHMKNSHGYEFSI